jgi:hypothetical protein
MEKQNSENGSRNHKRFVSKAMRIIGMVFMGLTLTVLFALIFGFVVMWLWNWLMPAIFGLGTITFWQAFGILVMAKLLFGAFGMRPHSYKRKYSQFHEHKKAFFNGEWDFRHSPRNWRHYKKFWDEEGKAAYKDYLKRTESEK